MVSLLESAMADGQTLLRRDVRTHTGQIDTWQTQQPEVLSQFDNN